MAIDRYAIEEAINENISVDVESAVSAIEYLIEQEVGADGAADEARSAVDDAISLLSRFEAALDEARDALSRLP